MENITSTAELLEAIQILEAEQASHLQQVKENFYYTRQSLRPVNIIGSSLKSMVSTPNLGNKILTIGVGILTGYLSRKAMFLGSSTSKVRRIFGNVLQLGITGLVARSPKAVKSFKQFIAERLSRRRKRNIINP